MRRSIVSFIMLQIFLIVNGIVVVAQDTEETNKEAVRAAYAEYSEVNPYALGNILHTTFMMNQGNDTLYETSHADAVEYDIALFGAMPDLQASPEVLIAQDDWVAAYVVYSGTFTQPYSFEPITGSETIQPSNEAILWTEIIFFHFDDISLVDEVWSVSDPTVLFGQLGIFPQEGEESPQEMLALPAGYQSLSVDELTASFASGMENRNIDILNEVHAQGLTGYTPSSDYYSDPFIVWSRDNASAMTLESAQQDAPFTQTLAQALPDNTITANITVAEGDWIATLRTLSGTFSEDFDFAGFGAPIPHNDLEISWQQALIYRFDEGGLIIEGWLEQDITPLFVGLGLIPMDEE